ncbi:MAG: HNH endonuclease [Kofleriaceae bacterium]
MGHVDDPHAHREHSLTSKQRKRLLARDMHQCRVPGCRARRHLDLHHIMHREHGGDDSDTNLVTLCSGHHRLHHMGLLDITGHAPGDLTFRRARSTDDEEPSRPRGHAPRTERQRRQ